MPFVCLTSCLARSSLCSVTPSKGLGLGSKTALKGSGKDVRGVCCVCYVVKCRAVSGMLLKRAAVLLLESAALSGTAVISCGTASQSHRVTGFLMAADTALPSSDYRPPLDKLDPLPSGWIRGGLDTRPAFSHTCKQTTKVYFVCLKTDIICFSPTVLTYEINLISFAIV